jgi:hypothetical protein
MSWSRLARPAALAAVLWFSPAAPAQVFADNFNTGTDTGWTRYQPLSTFGAGGTWSFPNGGYRIQAAHTPDLANLGPGRAGSIRQDASLNYTNFFVAADVVDWNNAVPQSFGLGARLTQIGLGTTDGYLFLFDTAATNNFSIYRVNNERVDAAGGGATLATGSLTLTPGTTYRFTFEGAGGTFVGRVFQGAVPLLTVTNATPDTTYASGFSGFIVAEDTAGAINGADATFDNYLSAPVNPVPEPATWALTLMGGLAAWRWRRAPKIIRTRGLSHLRLKNSK